MLFVINNLKYDTGKMELISTKCEYSYLSVICGDFVKFDAKEVQLWKSKKGNWLLTFRKSSGPSQGIAITEDKAKDILLDHDIKAYERIFGELEEA